MSSRLSDEAKAFEMTRRTSTVHFPKRLPKEPLKEYKPPAEGKEQTINHSQVIRLDSIFTGQWKLLCHAGFVTYPHINANGLCSWIYAHHSIKIWTVLEPKYTYKHDTRNKLIEFHKSLYGAPHNWSFKENCNMYTTFLEPGSVL